MEREEIKQERGEEGKGMEIRGPFVGEHGF